MTTSPGAINDYFLVPVAAAFEHCGSLGREALAAELVEHFEYWSVDRLLSHEGREVFRPRDLPDRFARRSKDGPTSSLEQVVRAP